tara:strand:+ start:307 stop:864 length:558 start_codon:yes stop_codon:yes gene_type:complete
MNSRLFIGINVSHLLKDIILMTSSTVECDRKAIKWNTGTNLHITISFLGNVDQGSIPGIIDKIKSLYLVEPFKICIEKTGVFPNDTYPKVFWLGVEQGKHYLEGMHNSLNKLLKGYVKSKNEGIYIPHITIGRSTSLMNYKNLKLHNYLNALYEPIEINVNSIGLFESKLQPEGPNYTLLEKFTL